MLDDLFFMVKIVDAAKRAGLETVVAEDESKVFELAREIPALIIVDLNTKAVAAVELIRKLKAHPETQAITLLAFVSHVQVELKQQAQEAGADKVLPRSTFSTSLPAILEAAGA